METHVPTTAELGQRKLRILCIDDAATIRRAIVAYLGDLGHTVDQAQDGTAGLELINAAKYDAVLLDLAMPGISGLDVLRAVSSSHPHLPVIVISGTGAIQDVIAALRLGAWDFITKPIEDMAILEYALAKALERVALITENQLHRERLEAQVRKRTAKLRAEIFERQNVETALRASLSEKEVLLKEVHHRVKNNLQLVNSLLYLQASTSDDPELRNALEKGQGRIYSMSLVHEELYRSDDLASVDMRAYTQRLCMSFSDSAGGRIRIGCTSDAIQLPVTQSVPIGLILNELITNALKYAYPEGTLGDISVSVRQDGGMVAMVVEDGGIGLPKDATKDTFGSLGLTLVRGLVDQLHGQLDILNKSGSGRGSAGVRIEIRFPRESS
jgi:two-component sensor histidine kinase